VEVKLATGLSLMLIVWMDVSEHVAERNQLQQGQTISMSLIGSAIHILKE